MRSGLQARRCRDPVARRHLLSPTGLDGPNGDASGAAARAAPAEGQPRLGHRARPARPDRPGAGPTRAAPLGLVVDVVDPSVTRYGERPRRRVVLRPTRQTKVGTWSKTTTWHEVVGTTYQQLAVRADHREVVGQLLALYRANARPAYGYGNPRWSSTTCRACVVAASQHPRRRGHLAGPRASQAGAPR